LEDKGTVESLPMNTYFSGLLDLADGSEASVESDYRKSGPSGFGGPYKKFPLPVNRPPPLRQPFFNNLGNEDKNVGPDQARYFKSFKRSFLKGACCHNCLTRCS
jgi:hypothetical protein